MQVDLFVQQMIIACRLHRPVSVHCVRAHAALMQCLTERPSQWLAEGLLPPRPSNSSILFHDWLPPAIALHSFSGSAQQVRELLALEGVGERLYFGFSHTINVAMGAQPGSTQYSSLLETIRAVPEHALLIESDVDESDLARMATALAAKLVAEARSWTVERAIQCTAQNGMRFLQWDPWRTSGMVPSKDWKCDTVNPQVFDLSPLIKLDLVIVVSPEVDGVTVRLQLLDVRSNAECVEADRV